MPPARAANLLPSLISHVSCVALCAILLVAVGQPVFTDDLWWHLALGKAFGKGGPWLDADPLLFTAPGPPAVSSWLADLALAGILHAGGFAALRLTHVAAVGGILALAWALLERAGGSRPAASLATSAFVPLAAYRLVQLRPELWTIFATLSVYALLLTDAHPASPLRLALAAALFGIWANVHAGFPLGLILIASALAGLLGARPLRRSEERQADLSRARRLAFALAACGLATLANPGGLAPHLAYVRAGIETPSLARVADEWARFEPFALPVPHLPPAPLAWGIAWGLFALTPIAAVWTARRWRRSDAKPSDVDPALVAVAVAALAAMLGAVRFLWMGVFPLLLLVRCGRVARSTGRARARAAAWTGAAAALLLVPGFWRLGDWPMIARGIPPTWSGYAKPYPASKYFAAAVWFLEDAGLGGRLFADYSISGFLGFWLAPQIQTFVNGSLNVSRDAISANLPLRQRRGAKPGESFLGLLDRFSIDLFVGTQLPRLAATNRPWFYTTSLLERTPGWLPVFRNLVCAVYLRANDRNRENLRRVQDYYAREGVPFDPQLGFDPGAAIRESFPWALRQGLVPVQFQDLSAAAEGRGSTYAPGPAQERVAQLYAALGLYERAIEIDRGILQEQPGAVGARRRLVWSLLRLGRSAKALDASRPLGSEAASDRELSRRIAAAASRLAVLDDAEEAAALRSQLPVFTPDEAARLLEGVLPPEVREP